MENRTNVKGVLVSTEHYIGGKRVASEKSFATINPNQPTQILAEISRGDSATADLAVVEAQKGFEVWSQMSVGERSAIMHKLADLIESRAQDIATVECMDMGMRYESLVNRLVPRGARNFRSYAQIAMENDSETQLRKNIISWFVEQTSLEVPPSMIDNYLDNLVEDIRSRNGETLDEDKYRSEMRSSTERSVKWYLIRKALIITEAIEVSDEELKDEVSLIVESVSGSGQSKEIERFYKKPSNRDSLLSELIEKKLFALLKSYAKIDEVEIQTSELRKQG